MANSLVISDFEQYETAVEGLARVLSLKHLLLTAKDFATVLGEPHNMQMDRKDGVGIMAIITHAP